MPMSFVQIIEFSTSQLDAVTALMDEWMEATDGKRSAHRSLVTKDRDREDTYVQMVEFPSYEDAMANSDLPETGSFATRLAELCDGPLSFRNLDLVREDAL